MANIEVLFRQINQIRLDADSGGDACAIDSHLQCLDHLVVLSNVKLPRRIVREPVLCLIEDFVICRLSLQSIL